MQKLFETSTAPAHENLVSDDKLMKLLLANGADPNASIDDDEPKVTSFRMAVRLRHDRCLRTFLRHDRSLANHRWSHDGNTPLHVAYDGCNVRVLLKYGANIRAVNNEGDTPLYRKALRYKSAMSALMKVDGLEEDKDKLIFHIVTMVMARAMQVLS